MNARRLLKLAAFLDMLPPQKFDFSIVAYQEGKPMMEALKAGDVRCGTVGCAIGWLPACFPRGLRWKPNSVHQAFPDVVLRSDPGVRDYDAAAKWFGLDTSDAHALFTPGQTCHGVRATRSAAPPKEVADRIRRVVSALQDER